MATINIPLNQEQYTFAVEGGGFDFKVSEIRGTEKMSELYDFDISLVTENGEIDFEDLLGQVATVAVLDMSGEIVRYVNGVINRFQQLHKNGRFFVYEAQIVPQLQLLTYRRDHRIFQSLTTQEIIKQVFTAANLISDSYRFDLNGSYQPREYCVQYGETDFDFVSRLMEEDGIYYFFEHTEHGQCMVVCDSEASHEVIVGEPEIIFHDYSSYMADEDYIFEFAYVENLVSGKVSLNDFNFKKPALNLLANKSGDADQDLEQYIYPGSFDNPDRGDKLAGIYLQSLQTQKRTAFGRTNCRRMVPGYRFTLADHERASLNQEYVITEVNHEAEQPAVFEEGNASGASSYVSTFSCIPANVPYKPLRDTLKPFVKGLQTAIVVGPSGEEIYTDEYGRVKVQFHWDRQGQNDENSSCWIRVSQAWAGTGWGAMFLPRIGQEVIVEYINGDPDRPIVTGRVYHGTNRPPYALPGEKTKSTIKSNSSKGGGGSNEIRFEDKKGSEEIFVHGQKDWTIAIENDKNQTVGNDESLSVGNNRTKNVGKDQTETVGANKTISVGENHSESIGSSASITVGTDLSLDVGGSRNESIGKNHSESVGANSSTNVGKNYSLDVGENASENVGKNASISIGKELKLDVGESGKVSIGKDLSVMVGKKAVISVDDSLTLKCGSASIIMKKDGTIQIKGKDINIKGSGKVVVKGSKIANN